MRARNNCPGNLSKNGMTAISAPYNFVPLNRWVHIPEWSRQVSHDWPFQDGLSGEIHYRLVADSPLLVGGEQLKHENDPSQPNTEVNPCRLPDGRYAIPGSSLKGMLRAIIEIAGFGRMRMVDEIRPGLRDISGKNVASAYTARVRGKVKTGFLRQRPDGGQEIVPCKMVRVSHRELESALGARKPIFRARINIAEKYRVWSNLCRREKWNPDEIRFDKDGFFAINLGEGGKSGFPVFTGQISDSTKKKGKYKDFIFYDRDESKTMEVKQQTWRDFLLIHGEEDGKADMPWPGYWRQKFRDGEEVPVFYVEDRGLLRIGLAYMPKLAGDFTTHDLIRHANEAHLGDAPGAEKGYDLADLLFGAIGEQQTDALRGRVSCETAVAEGSPTPETAPNTILNSPKPSYFPNYIEQPATPDGGHLEGKQYQTYMDTGKNKPVIRGYKRYPARTEGQVSVQKLQSGQKTSVQIRLHPLPKGTRFTGRIVFHNLKPEELGALLWAVTWGGNAHLRHGLGMGKPFGFGQVYFEINEVRTIPNDPQANAPSLLELMDRFKTYMDDQVDDEPWEKTTQITNLLAMADPESATHLSQGMELRHMCLNMEAKPSINEFLWAKQNSLVLRDYVAASKYIRRIEEAEQDRRCREAEEREKREVEEKARKKAEAKADFEALPEAEKARIQFERFIGSLPETLTKDRYPELVGKANEYIEQAASWSADEREQVARQIEQAYDHFGWGKPGSNSKQKKKQEQKKREALKGLLQG